MERFITGDTGAGKSGYMEKRGLESLATTNRYWVTNLALKWEPWVDGKGVARIGLSRLAEELYPWADIAEWRARTFFFPPLREGGFEAVRWFFLYRPREREGQLILERWDELLIKVQEKDRHVVLFGTVPGMPPCHYSIDEGHEFFGSEDWGTLEKSHRSYISQNRRAGDEVDLGTQVPGNVAAPLRKLSVECHYLVNHSKLNWMIVTQPRIVSVKVYKRVDRQRGDRPLRAWVERGVKRWREGYDSASGAGVQGVAADYGEGAKGIPWWAAIVLLLLGIVLGLTGCYHSVRAFISHSTASIVQTQDVHGKKSSLVQMLTPPMPNQAFVPPQQQQQGNDTNKIQWIALGKVGFSDGQTYTLGVDAWQFGNYVRISGKFYKLP